MSKERSVLKELREITHVDIKTLLDAKQCIDLAAGIIIVKLEKLPVMGELDQEYDFYAARVLPATLENPNFVNPHYHKNGMEPYRFLSSSGEMNIGSVKDNEVVWNEPKKVSVGDEVEIEGGKVHSYRNLGNEPADFVFACPKNHLVNNDPEHSEGDRYFVKAFKNGLPPWYK